jgi:hypothetical protein
MTACPESGAFHSEDAARKHRLPPVHGALHTQPAAIQHVRVDHGRADIGVTEQFLDGADV